MEKTMVGGVFRNSEEAVAAIERLKESGFNTEHISVLAKNDDEINEIEERTDVDVLDESSGRGKNAGKGAGIGAGTGGVLGGIVGLIAEVGLLTIPGIGVLAAAGPLATTLSGAAIGATGGGIVGALTGAGIPEEDAKEYERYVKDGNILLMVEVDEEQRSEIERNFTESHSLNTDMYVVR
ncbi:general stress protein [Bacillus sp. ISL-47]|uniref:general stress protein n=1 Tax=Bacillus sp. ISL-47 TaxID=2819130 RepID=UPI001BE8BC7F|nr:general stress protein [Bacillus sp. ISL-47]MBT2689112.1 general stress protein [Bacillus sp. ISL-47]MBT2708568.1 general stress protein [Pseudomonas sp. ISL-84]